MTKDWMYLIFGMTNGLARNMHITWRNGLSPRGCFNSYIHPTLKVAICRKYNFNSSENNGDTISLGEIYHCFDHL